jgi:hypothetical protein
MIPMERDTLVLIAAIVAIAGVIFLFREMNKAKQDVENLKNFSAHLVQRLGTTDMAIEDEDEDEETRDIKQGEMKITEENKEE